VPLNPTLPTVDWATEDENAALHACFRAECGATTEEHAFPLWMLQHMRACADHQPSDKPVDAETLLAWILNPARRRTVH
jgi:hypothetical protein